jgi:deoxyinosine 3'endonuclease (endonuclease V)
MDRTAAPSPTHDDALRQQWVRAQYEVAAQVHIRPDDWDARPAVAHSTDFLVSRATPPTNESNTPLYYGGVDVSFPATEDDAPSVAVYVILDASTGKVVYHDSTFFDLSMPYIPSFLAFREIDPLVRLVQAQQRTQPSYTPRAILVDGNGVLHPRGAGLACFLGVRTGLPTIGIGKSLFCQGKLTKAMVWEAMDESLARAHRQLPALVRKANLPLSTHDKDVLVIFDKQSIGNPQELTESTQTSTSDDLPFDRGAAVQALASYGRGLAIPLEATVEQHEDEGSHAETFRVLACLLVGHGGRQAATIRSSGGSKVPIFVSVGHKVSLREAVETAAALSLSRIPEPVRQADLMGRALLRQAAAAAKSVQS